MNRLAFFLLLAPVQASSQVVSVPAKKPATLPKAALADTPGEKPGVPRLEGARTPRPQDWKRLLSLSEPAALQELKEISLEKPIRMPVAVHPGSSWVVELQPRQAGKPPRNLPTGFSLEVHHDLVNGLDRMLPSNAYVAKLWTAAKYQDTAHQFDSKAHFDNCDFVGAVGYLHELMDYMDQAETAMKGVEGHLLGQMKESYFFFCGQALHAIQDFYAHSNFVELNDKPGTRRHEIPIPHFWRADGLAQINGFKGIHSGRVWWGFPKRCTSENTPTHDAMAKDKPDQGHGKDQTRCLGLSHHEVARYLAARASQAFLEDLLERHPVAMSSVVSQAGTTNVLIPGLGAPGHGE